MIDDTKLPQNVEAEAALLSALMLNNDFVDRVSTVVQPAHFFDSMHARIYDRILLLITEGKPANPITLRPYFHEEWIKFGPPEDGGPPPADMRVSAYCASLTGGYSAQSGYAAIIGALDFAQQIRELAWLRGLHRIYREAAEKAVDTSEGIDPAAIISEVEQETEGFTRHAETMRTRKLSDAWDDEIERQQRVHEGSEKPSGIRIDLYDDWNAVCGRMDAGDLIYLGGRPSMGKTGVSLAVALGSALAGHPTEFIGAEMSEAPTIRRIIANRIYDKGVTSNYAELSAGRHTMQDARAIARAREELDTLDLFISTPDEIDVEDIAPHIRRRQRALARNGKTLRLVVIDYLGRLNTKKPFLKTIDRVTYISRVLKDTAKKCGVAMVVLVQLSREVERRDDKRPILADLRDSGSLEQDADTVVFVYRDEYYLERAEPPKSEAKKHEAWMEEMLAVSDRLELYSAKRREGALTKRTGFFFSRHQAVRSSGFYQEDLYRRDHQPGTFFEEDGQPEMRG